MDYNHAADAVERFELSTRYPDSADAQIQVLIGIGHALLAIRGELAAIYADLASDR